MLLSLLWAASGVSESNQPTPELALYNGAWSRIPDDQADAARISSIDSAISDLSWIVRGMASGVLRKTTAPPGEMLFSWDGEQLYQVVDGDNGRFERPVRLEGEPQTLTDPRGEDFTSRWSWTPAGLEVRWEQAQAFGSNVYRVDETDQTLRVQHRIQVTALDGVEAIEFESRFARDSLPAVSSAAALQLGDSAETEGR